jgi:hypothetical protein
MLVDKGHSVLALGQNAGEVAGVKIQTKAIPLKHRYGYPIFKPNTPARLLQLYRRGKPKRVIFNPGTENPEFYQN